MPAREATLTAVFEGHDAMLPSWFRVARIRSETQDTFTLELTADGEKTDFTFQPGQFNMLYVFGVGEVPISISGPPPLRDRIIHTIRAVGTVTRNLWRLKHGDIVGVRGPFGTAWPLKEAEGRDVVIVTGGIGLAPLRPVLYHLLHHRKKFGRVILLYGARTPNDLLYGDEFLWPALPLDLTVDYTVDRAKTDWRGQIGVVTTLIPRAEFDPSRAVTMVCGPEVMMRFTIRALSERGVASERIYVSMERSMKCAVGFCGHCQYGPAFVCKDGPVFRWDRVERLFGIREL